MKTKLPSSILNKVISAIMFVLIVASTFSPASVMAAPDYADSVILGQNNILTAEDSGAANFLIAQQAVLSQSGTIQSLNYFVSNPGGQLMLGIYTDNGGNPGALITQTDAFTPVAGWNMQNVTTPVSLPAGTYWLAHFAEYISLKSRYQFTGLARGYSYTFGALPGTFSTSVQSAGMHYSFYATLTR
jgi:hypothetical protein